MQLKTVIKSLGTILLTTGLQAMVAMHEKKHSLSDRQYPHAELIEDARRRAFDETRDPQDRFAALTLLVTQSKHLDKQVRDSDEQARYLDEQARARISLARLYITGIAHEEETIIPPSISEATTLLTSIFHMPVADKYKDEAIGLYTQLTGNYSAMVDRYYRATGRESPSGHKSPSHGQRKKS